MTTRLQKEDVRILQQRVEFIKERYKMRNVDIIRLAGVASSTLTELLKHGKIGRLNWGKINQVLRLIEVNHGDKTVEKVEHKERTINVWTWVALGIATVVFILALVSLYVM